MPATRRDFIGAVKCLAGIIKSSRQPPLPSHNSPGILLSVFQSEVFEFIQYSNLMLLILAVDGSYSWRSAVEITLFPARRYISRRVTFGS